MLKFDKMFAGIGVNVVFSKCPIIVQLFECFGNYSKKSLNVMT